MLSPRSRSANCWSGTRHVVKPFEVPKEWMRFRSMDWGSASPFSVGWWVIVQDETILKFWNETCLLSPDCKQHGSRAPHGTTPGDALFDLVREYQGCDAEHRDAIDRVLTALAGVDLPELVRAALDVEEDEPVE